jgi:hypothetical protein
MTLLLGMGLTPVLAQDGLPDDLGSAVRQAVEEEGDAQVVVALEEPSAVGEQEGKRTKLRRKTQRMQTDVLSVVSASEFRTTHRYDAVPALAGTIRSTEALDRLARHPSVRRIDLMQVGRGASTPA